MAEGYPIVQQDSQQLTFGPLASVTYGRSASYPLAAEPRDSSADLSLVDLTQSNIDEHAWFTYLSAEAHLSGARVAYQLLVKRALDVIFASLLLVILAPMLVVITLCIWIGSRGPAFYKQDRIGRYGKPFTLYKFRTMIPDRRTTELPFVGTERRERHKSERDPRVTTVGRFLRRTSIDEWPQLINILRGEMSFIGPRPELPRIVAKYQPWQHQRHLVRPGMSGWWQIHGRSDRSMHENTDLDIYYVANLSPRLDLHIFVRTFKAVISRNGAY
jgi:lipopolysaccharide/colanic/teichoic acid biosynthesis glycosyltransferase